MPRRSSSGSSRTTLKVVKYIGPYDVKIITEKDWKAIEIDDQGDVKWDWRNDWAVPVEEFSEVALNYCKNQDPNLKIIDKASD